jgi:hypothetical protein
MVSDGFFSHVQVIYILIGYKSQKFLVVYDREMRNPENIHPGQSLYTGIGSFKCRHYIGYKIFRQQVFVLCVKILVILHHD